MRGCSMQRHTHTYSLLQNNRTVCTHILYKELHKEGIHPIFTYRMYRMLYRDLYNITLHNSSITWSSYFLQFRKKVE